MNIGEFQLVVNQVMDSTTERLEVVAVLNQMAAPAHLRLLLQANGREIQLCEETRKRIDQIYDVWSRNKEGDDPWLAGGDDGVHLLHRTVQFQVLPLGMRDIGSLVSGLAPLFTEARVVVEAGDGLPVPTPPSRIRDARRIASVSDEEGVLMRHPPKQ